MSFLNIFRPNRNNQKIVKGKRIYTTSFSTDGLSKLRSFTFSDEIPTVVTDTHLSPNTNTFLKNLEVNSVFDMRHALARASHNYKHGTTSSADTILLLTTIVNRHIDMDVITITIANRPQRTYISGLAYASIGFLYSVLEIILFRINAMGAKETNIEIITSILNRIYPGIELHVPPNTKPDSYT